MSRGSEWIPMDKYLAQEFKSIKREFSMIEAMFSYTLDVDNGYEGTISGYSKLWGWSRNKARKFLEGIRTVEGHSKDSRRTHKGHPIHFIDKDLWSNTDSRRTVEGHSKDSQEYTTNNPNPNPNKKLPDSDESVDSFYKSKSGKKLTGKKLDSFNTFWEYFDFKNGKASAADSWLKISPLTNNILNQILIAAKIESNRRPEIIQKNGTPKWAQGWLSERRWEDESYSEPVNGKDVGIKSQAEIELEDKEYGI